MPQELSALSVRCDYCKRENPLPPEVVHERQRVQREALAAQQAARIYQDQQNVAKSSRRIGLWITLFSVLPAVDHPARHRAPASPPAWTTR